VFLSAAEKLGVTPAECIVIEDSAVGVEAAVRAGMRVLALTTTHERDKLTNAAAIYRGFAEIPLEEWLAAC
jgi:beta-phosphoglucomutase-like phosphatase (HAD superfamily)